MLANYNSLIYLIIVTLVKFVFSYLRKAVSDLTIAQKTTKNIFCVLGSMAGYFVV